MLFALDQWHVLKAQVPLWASSFSFVPCVLSVAPLSSRLPGPETWMTPLILLSTLNFPSSSPTSINLPVLSILVHTYLPRVPHPLLLVKSKSSYLHHYKNMLPVSPLPQLPPPNLLSWSDLSEDRPNEVIRLFTVFHGSLVLSSTVWTLT